MAGIPFRHAPHGQYGGGGVNYRSAHGQPPQALQWAASACSAPRCALAYPAAAMCTTFSGAARLNVSRRGPTPYRLHHSVPRRTLSVSKPANSISNSGVGSGRSRSAPCTHIPMVGRRLAVCDRLSIVEKSNQWGSAVARVPYLRTVHRVTRQVFKFKPISIQAREAA